MEKRKKEHHALYKHPHGGSGRQIASEKKGNQEVMASIAKKKRKREKEEKQKVKLLS